MSNIDKVIISQEKKMKCYEEKASLKDALEDVLSEEKSPTP